MQAPCKLWFRFGKILSLGVAQCFWVASVDWGVLRKSVKRMQSLAKLKLTWVNEDRKVRVGVSGASLAANADTALDLTGVLNEVGDTLEPRTTFGFGFDFGSVAGGFNTALGSGGGTLS